MLVSEMVFWFLLTENVMPLSWSVPLPRITRHENVNASKYIERWKSISKAESQRKYDTLFFLYMRMLFFLPRLIIFIFLSILVWLFLNFSYL